MANDGAVSETKCAYDVFLSFRGEDTRHTFTGKLYAALRRKGIITFMDDEELKRGDQLGPVLLKAIEESSMWIVVFSENYADSSWCLDELVKIHECMNSTNKLVWPIFYKVDPSDVRHQKLSYGQAMTKHEARFGKHSEKVKKWRSALTHIANLKGEYLKEEQGRDESEFIEYFVWEIFIKLSPKDLSKNEYIVGRENQVERLKSSLDLESLDISCALLGIHGTGGIGKTTLAKALYDSIYKKFEASSFLFNVRETSNQLEGLKKLQKMLLLEILEVEDSKIKFKNKEEGIREIKNRLGLKRILIVLDDVDDIEQLQYLAGEGNWFGRGSRVIITTRNTQLLDQGGVQTRYEVKMLKYQESLELFCQSAFRKSYPESNYEELSNRAVLCCKGLPLALKVLGSHMVGKDFGGWKDALDRYEKSPHPDVQRVLRISYDSLHFNEKNIFLDIACFFKGQKLEYVKGVLDSCDFFSGDGIATLVNKSLLTVDKYNNGFHFLGMHDLLQDMGREIVKEEAPNEVGERSRLWHHGDVLQVLADNNGSSKIQGIVLKSPQEEEINNCIDTVFETMKNLRILIVRNTLFSKGPSFLPNNLKVLDWEKYPSESFPSGSYPRKIGIINLSRGRLLKRLEPFKRCEYLTSIDISECDMVTKFPDVSGALNLRELTLDKCYRLVSIHESVGHLANLVRLSAYNCYNLKSFVRTIYLPSLEYLSFNSCSRLAHFPEIKGMMSKPLKINMSGTAIEELPESIKKLTGLNYLDMSYCTELHHLPSSLFMLPNLVTLNICHCGEYEKSMRRFEGIHSADSRLETLSCDDVGLFDQHLDTIIFNFVETRWSIDGERRQYYRKFYAHKDHVLLCDLRVVLSWEESEDVGVGVGNNHWKKIQVFCETELDPRSWGLYVYKREINMEDIQFMSHDFSSSSVSNMEDIKFTSHYASSSSVWDMEDIKFMSHYSSSSSFSDMEDIKFMSHYSSSSSVWSLDAISEDENVSSTLTERLEHLLRKIQKPGPSSQQSYDEGLVEEDLSSEDVENVDGLNHNIPQPDTHDKKLWDFFCYGGEDNQEAGYSSQQRYDEGLVEEDSSSEDDGGENNQEVGPSSQQRNDKGLVEEDSSSEDVENVDGLNHNNPQPDIHIANTTCLAIWTVLKKLLCLSFFFSKAPSLCFH